MNLISRIIKKLFNKCTQFIIILIPNFIVKRIKEDTLLEVNQYYSQEGEDIVLDRIIGDQKEGFYVDVGAHHPVRFSNTYKLYNKGWSGINIDACPDIMEEFNSVRPKDINLELGVSSCEGTLIYYMFNEPALNTFSKSEAAKKDGLYNYKIIEKRNVSVDRLENVLNEQLPMEKVIDFMSVDVEGLDIEVLMSNDWNKYRPRILCVEALKMSCIDDVISDPLYDFLRKQNYSLFSKLYNSLIFIDDKQGNNNGD